MDERVWIEDIAKYEGREVELRGWLTNRRSSGKLHFLQIRDGTGVIQAVMFKGDVEEALFQRCDHLAQETSLVVRGTVKKDPRSPIGFELSVKDLKVHAEPVGEFPIGNKEHGVAFLMDQRHLWLRSRKQVATLRIRAAIVTAVREYFDSNGFVLLDTPIFTPAACEGTTTLFPAQYFEDQTAYLTQSGQLYNEANAMALGRVYCFGPTFRAEKSKTRRHLTEFWMLEPEAAYAHLDDMMHWIVYVRDPTDYVRVADAFGVHAVIAPKDRAVGITPVVSKVASGAAETVPYISVTNLARTLRELKELGIWIVGADEGAGTDLYDAKLGGALATHDSAAAGQLEVSLVGGPVRGGVSADRDLRHPGPIEGVVRHVEPVVVEPDRPGEPTQSMHDVPERRHRPPRAVRRHAVNENPDGVATGPERGDETLPRLVHDPSEVAREGVEGRAVGRVTVRRHEPHSNRPRRRDA